MPSGTLRKRLGAGVLSVALVLLPPNGGMSVTAAEATLGAVVAGVTVATAPARAEARARFRFGGGYWRPSIRTPSIGVPASSGGYGRGLRPPESGFSRRPSVGQPSAGDRVISGRSAGEALRDYRARGQQVPPSAAAPSTPSGPGMLGRDGYGGAFQGRPSWTVDRGWSIPSYAYRSPPSFGMWNGLFLWFLIDTLSRPGRAEFFYNHQNDPGYRTWHADAEHQAQDHPELKARLGALDRQLAERQGQPRDPNYLPPDATPEVALAPDGQTGARSGWPALATGPGTLPIPLVLGGGVLFLFWMWRRRQGDRVTARIGGSPTMEPLKTAADVLRRKLSGKRYTPSLFRVGMTLTMDPTPFILAAQATKVPVPQAAGPDLLASVQAVAMLRNGATLYRLYLDERSFFQLHLDASGAPDECRFFALIDEVNPASEQEWAFWLDPQDGMIGWPEFQTKDGKAYERAWAPGSSRIAPRAFSEARADLGGSRTARIEAMLYVRPTATAAPAPEAEYILVALVEAEGQARIAIHAGIDVNPAALSLA